MLERINRVDSKLKSFATLMSEQALADATPAFANRGRSLSRTPPWRSDRDQRLVLHERRSHDGRTAVLKDFVPTFDATGVSKTAVSGAVVLGNSTSRKEQVPGTTVLRRPY